MIEVGSSFTLNRLDIAPLCHVGPLAPDETELLEGFAEPSGTPAIYIAALPFPGRTDGRRLTITEEERDMIWESSLYSETTPAESDGPTNRLELQGRTLAGGAI